MYDIVLLCKYVCVYIFTHETRCWGLQIRLCYPALDEIIPIGPIILQQGEVSSNAVGEVVGSLIVSSKRRADASKVSCWSCWLRDNVDSGSSINSPPKMQKRELLFKRIPSKMIIFVDLGRFLALSRTWWIWRSPTLCHFRPSYSNHVICWGNSSSSKPEAIIDIFALQGSLLTRPRCHSGAKMDLQPGLVGAQQAIAKVVRNNLVEQSHLANISWVHERSSLEVQQIVRCPEGLALKTMSWWRQRWIAAGRGEGSSGTILPIRLPFACRDAEKRVRAYCGAIQACLLQ